MSALVPFQSAFRPLLRPVPARLSRYVSALMAVEAAPVQGLKLSIVPHETLLLSIQLGRGRDGLDQKAESGLHTCLTGIRDHAGTFQAPGDCFNVFALLTPLGAMHLVKGQCLADAPRIRAPLAALTDRASMQRLESDVAAAPTLADKADVFGRWLEACLDQRGAIAAGALRSARAAMALCRDPAMPPDELAARECITRRQLERDFRRWLNTSPRHLTQVSRLQAVARHAQSGMGLSAVAAEAGFADQPHMTRVVRQLTGLTPQSFVRSLQTPLSAAFRHATQGGVVYL
jgi:AraC-like DNA-binding protein